MKRFFQETNIVLSALLCVFLVSCASIRKESSEQVTLQAHHQISEGDYQNALDLYNTAYSKHPNNETLVDSYIMTLDKLKQLADKAFEIGNFVLAENIYSVLLNNYSYFEKISKSLSFTKAAVYKKLKNSKISLCKKTSLEHLNSGNINKAVGTYKDYYQQYPDNAELTAHFINTLNSIKKRGDKAFSKEDYPSAGVIYYTLVSNIQNFRGFHEQLSFTRTSLDEGRKICAQKLTKKGLEQYRKGNLADAISTWKDLLKFDPENTEIIKAIKTTTTQLKNLKKK